VRGEQDFVAYVDARGPALVRCLVLLGLTRSDAEAAAAEAFASLRADWPDLVFSGELDDALFGGVLGTDPETTAALREEAATLPPLLLSYDRVRAVVTRRRRRQWLTAGGLVAAATAAALVWSLLDGAGGSTPPPDDGLGPARVSVADDDDDDAGVVWWADGTLHLATVDVRVGEVRRVVAAGDAAAYVDGRGRLVAVYPDGHRTLLGRPTTYSPLVSNPASGLVSWVDASRTGVQRLVVWDLTDERQVSGVVVSGLRTEPTGFVGGWLTFRTGTTDFVWNPRGGDPVRTGDGAPRADGDRWASLVDTVARTRLEQVGLTLRVVRKGSGRMTYLPGVAGSLSADGRLVIARPVDGDAPGLYDAHSGERLDSWDAGGWRVLDATFVDDDRVAWLAERDDADAVLVLCGSPGQPMDCSSPLDLGATGTPLIARDSQG
jgi:hypothetical protein